jgi:hypothetical protein
MRHRDRYVFFCTRAVTEPVANPEFMYFLERSTHTLVKRKAHNLQIKKDWIELPKVATEKKKSFIVSFANQQKDENLKSLIMNIVDSFDDSSSFHLDEILKESKHNLAQEFFFASGTFFQNAIDSLYSKYGIGNDMRIDFEGRIYKPEKST